MSEMTAAAPPTGHFDPAISIAWQALIRHAEAQTERGFRVAGAFALDADRARRFTLDAAGLTLDYSKQRIDTQTMQLLFALAHERAVEARRDAMFAGERINASERRAVLHVALREPAVGARQHLVDSRDVVPEVHAELARMRAFSDRVRAGEWRGRAGQAITDVVNIGIGGSDLGPQMVCEALRRDIQPRLAMHFVANVDGGDLDRVLANLDPATTLFIVSSKTFTTQETIMNARRARAWLLAAGAADGDVAKHFVAVTANIAGAQTFGIAAENCFRFWDWVGGRYSLWSAVGLSIMIAMGSEAFGELLAGAHAMDEHFASAPLAANMPCVLALLGVWNGNFLGASSLCVAPYAQDLRRLPAYLQQLEMESNGKSVALDGTPLAVPSGSAIWGEPGSNGQHAYFQLLHQGTTLIPVDFIASLAATGESAEHHRVLLANCFAQSEALMCGKSAASARAEMLAAGMAEADVEALVPHRSFAGNRPSNTILLPALAPHSLGALIALYEHKVFVQGTIWGINSFDQWGVELGKQLAKTIDGELAAGVIDTAHDGSTRALMQRAIDAQRGQRAIDAQRGQRSKSSNAAT